MFPHAIFPPAIFPPAIFPPGVEVAPVVTPATSLRGDIWCDPAYLAEIASLPAYNGVLSVEQAHTGEVVVMDVLLNGNAWLVRVNNLRDNLTGDFVTDAELSATLISEGGDLLGGPWELEAIDERGNYAVTIPGDDIDDLELTEGAVYVLLLSAANYDWVSLTSVRAVQAFRG